jgi:hypothetical protein
MLRTLGYEETAQPEKRRGRRPKQQEGGETAALARDVGESNVSVTSREAMPAVAQAQEM